MYRYYHIDIEKFLSESLKWGNIRVDSSDYTVAEAQEYQGILLNSLKTLSNEEEMVIRAFYPKRNPEKIKEQAIQNKKAERTICDVKLVAVKGLRDFLEENYSIETLKRFYSFNVERFLLDSVHWERALKRLDRKRADLMELKAFSSDGISTGGKSDSTGTAVVKLTEVDVVRINICTCIEIKNEVLSLLDDYEKQVLGLFFPKRPSGYKVEAFGQKYYTSRGSVYRTRKTILDKIQHYIESKYFGKGV